MSEINQTTQSAAIAPPLLQMKNIHKAFGATKALSGVDLQVERGQVHILAGENGAGKSTLMKILTGVHQADAGEIFFQGQPFSARHPKEALMAGISMIYQEFNLAPHLPVHANLFLGHERKRYGIVQAAEQRRRTREIFDLMNSNIDPDIPVSHLGVAQRQLVEIARALSVDAKLIIMDEPTAALSDNETKKLFDTIRTLQAKEVGVIYISHYLEEFGEIGDVFSVFRDGERVGNGPMRSANPESIIQMMVGRKIDELYPKQRYELGDAQFMVKNATSANGTKEACLEVRKSEILGIAGLVGAGRTEMLRAIFGLDPARIDDLQMNGQTVLNPTPRNLNRLGIGLLSEDRAGEGLAQDMDIAVNISLPIPEMISRYGVISYRKRDRMALDLIKKVGIKAESPRQRLNQLSGGNQQKVAIARLLGADAKVLLLDEPTRGIDVGSKVEIYHLIGQLAKEGKSIIMVSSYLPELFGMCDSLCVMARGRLSKKYNINEIDEDGVMALATGLAEDCAASA